MAYRVENAMLLPEGCLEIKATGLKGLLDQGALYFISVVSFSFLMQFFNLYGSDRRIFLSHHAWDKKCINNPP